VIGRTDNSRRAYETIVENGLLSRAYLAIYTHVFNHGPVTRNKLDAALCPGKANPWPSRRLVEMERMGVLAVVGQDESGPHRMDIWDVTCNLPVDLPKRVSLKNQVRRELRDLEAALLPPAQMSKVLEAVQRLRAHSGTV
jgi:hypothetical protein